MQTPSLVRGFSGIFHGGGCSVFRRAEQLSGQEGGFGVGHAGDEVHDADVGGIEVVFFSGSGNTHEGDGLFVRGS